MKSTYNTTLYASSTAKKGITNSPKNCGNTPIGRYVTGWVDVNSI